MTEKQIALAKKNGTLNEMYEQVVAQAVRKKYSMSNELAILRQRDLKPDEFTAYFNYVEECKAAAKALLGL